MVDSTLAIQICIQVNGAPQIFDRFVVSGTSISQVLQDFDSSGEIGIASLLDRGYGVAIFGKKRDLNTQLQDGDRIEICAPLIASPMDARRRRAKREHKGGKM